MTRRSDSASDDARPERTDEEVLAALLRQVSADLSLICDRPLELEGVATRREREKVATGDGVHVSFRVLVAGPAGEAAGCVLFPLRDALALAAYQQGLDEEAVRARRRRSELDAATKQTLLELSELVGGSLDAALRRLRPGRIAVRSGGCQGVRAGQRPSFEHAPGAELLVGTLNARLGAFEPFELVVQLPALLVDGEPGRDASAA